MELETQNKAISLGNEKAPGIDLLKIIGSLVTPLFLRRLLVTVLGYFVLSLGVVLLVNSNLGIAPTNSISFILSEILPADLGLMTAIIYSIFVLLQLVILGKNFKVSSFLQVPMNMIFSLFLSVCTRTLAFPTPQIYVLRLLCHMSGVIVASLGICIYLRGKLPPLPPEGLLLAIIQRFKGKIQTVKVFFDFTVLAIAIIISLIATGRVIGMREGTFIAMLGIGKSMGFFSKHLGHRIDALFKLPSAG